jgi:hypothetical protein
MGYIPGSGISKNAIELENSLKKIDKQKGLNLLSNTIQILISFENEYSLLDNEKDDIIAAFSIRLLLGYFGLGDNNPKDIIQSIYEKIIIERFYLNIKYAMNLILRDLEDKEDNPYFIISIDEYQKVFY